MQHVARWPRRTQLEAGAKLLAQLPEVRSAGSLPIASSSLRRPSRPQCAFGRVTSIILRDNNPTGSITNWTGVSTWREHMAASHRSRCAQRRPRCWRAELTRAVCLSVCACHVCPSGPQVGDLHNLTWIEMGFNSISGTLPRVIGNIQNLVILNFPFNQIEGTLPDTLGDLNTRTDAELFDLILDRNAISGTLPAGLGKHAGLKMMQLGFNRLSGSIPKEFVNLTNVQVVQLNSNALGGELPEDMCVPRTAHDRLPVPPSTPPRLHVPPPHTALVRWRPRVVVTVSSSAAAPCTCHIQTTRTRTFACPITCPRAPSRATSTLPLTCMLPHPVHMPPSHLQG